MIRTSIWLPVGVIVAITLIVLAISSPNVEPVDTNIASGATNRAVALTCTSDMATAFHIHPTLRIVINGKDIEVPPDIGIRSSCMNALHTHDLSGVIHVESPQTREFTLADFFAVWEQPFSEYEILTYKANASHRIRVSVNGVDVDTYETTTLKDKDEIIINYETVAP
jgi:hypothetical protein